MTTDPLNAHPSTYTVIFMGIRKDVPADKFREAFADLLKTTPANIDRVLTRLPYIFKKNIRLDQALRYKAAIESVGGMCQIGEDGPQANAHIHTSPPAQADNQPQAHASTDTPTSTATRNSPETQQRPPENKRPMPGVAKKIVGAVRHFLFPDVPARSIDLKFKLPSPSARAKVGSASSGDLHHSEDDPLEFFRLFHTRIKLLNFAHLTVDKRLRANRELIKLFYSPAIKHLTALAKTGGVPETEDSRESLLLISDIAGILITSYALVFSNYYSGSKYHYARNRKKLLELAASILELMLLKQRARSLRYTGLDPTDWSMANTVFHVMRAYENTELPLPARISDLSTDAPRANWTLSDQFILLQVCAWFDLLRLPTALQWVIGSYLLKVDHAVQITDDTGTLNNNEMLVYCYGKQAAETRRLETPAGPALILNLHNLVEAMAQDCQARQKFNALDASHVMPRFAHFETKNHFVIRNQFLGRLNSQKENPASSHVQPVDDLRIFVGFSAIFAMLNHRRSAFASEDRLEDRLSRRSAAFATDGRETRQSLWSFSFQDESMTRFTTTESKETTPMTIGMLLAYGAGDEIHRPRLAVVSRIMRHAGRVLELDMRLIAAFCEPVVISFNQVKVIGLMVYNPRDDGHWSLAVAPRDVLIGVDQVALHRHHNVTPVTLTAILDASHDFYLFATTLTSSQLGFQGEPQYPAIATQRTSIPVY